jgi:hypothetical protein
MRLKSAVRKASGGEKNMDSTAESALETSETDGKLSQNSGRDVQNPETSERNWKLGMDYSWKEERWLTDDSSELYIADVQEWMETDGEYAVKYREGRFGPSDNLKYGEFDDLEDALEYAEVILQGEAELEQLRT